MLNKILGNKILHNLPFNKSSSHARPHENISGPAEKRSRALMIVQVGGLAEYYYMAVPAARIIEKYPKFILARPEIFRRPWDSIVRPDEILLPGQRYYVVPRQTVRKLRRRIKKSYGISSITKLPMDSAFQVKDSFSYSISKSSIMVKSGTKVKDQNRHVRFMDIENKKKESGSGGNMVPYYQKKGGNNNYMKEKGVTEKLRNLELHKKRRDRFENSWEPSLNAIDEHCINEY